MFKLTLIIWMLTGSQMTVEADGFKTEAQCRAHAAKVVSDLIKHELPFKAIGTNCEPYLKPKTAATHTAIKRERHG